jgi:putative dimethyl sulfoxide reductase chaperone
LILNPKEKQSLIYSVRLMSAFFWGPGLEFCQTLLQPSFWLPLEEILPRLDSQAVQAFDDLKAILNSFTSPQTLYEDLEEEYIRLFISDRQGIQTPLYASCYTEGYSAEKAPLMGEPALDMKKRLESIGLSLAEDIHEPPDHLSIELEYLYFLLNKGWADQNRIQIGEASAFAEDVLRPWVMKLHQGLAIGKTPGRFYPLLVTFLVVLLRFIGTIGSRG